MTEDAQARTDAFIARWTGVAASELSTSQSFLLDLCDVLGVDRPHATADQDYMFERPITFVHGNGGTSAGRIDLYRRGAFVLESKKLKRLVALNAERAAEEARGLVRWLRPEFQNPQSMAAPGPAPAQGELDTGPDEDEGPAAPLPAAKPAPWPKDPVAQVRAIAELLAASRAPLTLDGIAARFTARGPWKKRLPGLLDMLVALGRATVAEGRYSGPTGPRAG